MPVHWFARPRNLAVCFILSTTGLHAIAAAPSPPVPAPRCGDVPILNLTPSPLPSGVTGRVAFFAAEYDPPTLKVVRSMGLGQLNEVHAIASAYKPLVVEAGSGTSIPVG